MSNHVKQAVDILAKLGSLADTSRVLRDLENIEKAVIATRRIVMRKAWKREGKPKLVKPTFVDTSEEGE